MSATLHTLYSNGDTAMSHLFARYVAGEISDGAWDHIMNIFDSGDALPEEREALANFISDACLDLGPGEVEVPKADEVNDFVTITRAA